MVALSQSRNPYTQEHSNADWHHPRDGGEGLYPETNILPIELKSLDGVKFVKDTTFRFIVKIKEKQEDKFGVLYTSEKYFKNLESSIKESNPYFLNNSFNLLLRSSKLLLS